MTKQPQTHICLRKPAPFTLIFFFFLISSGLFNPVFAQVDNVDEAFSRAQELAFDGKRAEARELCRAILEVSPNYHDVRILIARTYSWDGRYADARRELSIVLESNPSYKDAHSALIDNEIWAEDYILALEASRSATRLYPTDERFLVKLASVHFYIGNENDALMVLGQAEQLYPSSTLIKDLRLLFQKSRLNYTLTASATQDRFSDVFGIANKSLIQLARATKYGSVIGRLNYVNRFETSGLQPEIDFYPSIGKGFYGYLNFGITESSLFPKYRFGAELYSQLPFGMEASAGFRYLVFNSGAVTIYTGSVLKYWRNYFFSLRSFFTPGTAGISRSINYTIRRYFSSPETYLSLTGGFGFSPEERRFQDVSGDVFLVKSRYIGLNGNKVLRYNLNVFGGIDLAEQELRFSPGDFITVLTINGGIQYKF